MQEKYLISSLNDVKKCLSRENIKIYGIGGLPGTRSEIWPFVPEFELICANKTGEYSSVSQDVKVKIFEISKKLVKKPEKILSKKQVIRYIENSSKRKKVGIYVMRPTEKMHQICSQYGWTLIANETKLYDQLDEKNEFDSLLKKLDFSVVSKKLLLSQLETNLEQLHDKFGERLAIQLTDVMTGGGKGTFFVSRGQKSVAKSIKKRIEIIGENPRRMVVSVSPFFEGPSLSITGCVTGANGILSSYLQYQLIDIEESVSKKQDANGVFCGHDWTISKAIPDSLQKKADLIVRKFGKEIRNKGYKGIFGLDLIWDEKENRLIPLEMNPRLIGTFPTAVHVHLDKKEVPLVAFHILEFMKINYKIESSKVYRKSKIRRGSHLILFNPCGKKIVFKKNISGGVYAIEDGRPKFLRKGFELKDLRRKNEFIITDGVPQKGLAYGKNRKIAKIITGRDISTNGFELNSWGKQVVNSVYHNLILKGIA